MYYSRAHYRRVNPPPDTERDIADRKRRNAALETARSEAEAKYYPLTADNVKEALAFTERRYRELIG